MTRKVTTMPRPVDADGSYTLKASDYTGYSLAFSGGNIAVIDEFGHIEAEFDAGDIPTIEAEPVKHGRWDKIPNRYMSISSKDGSYSGHATSRSVCREVNPNAFKTIYCPNCGAKMDGGTDHD